MRAMPFRTASEASVQFTPPRLQVGDAIFEAGDAVPSWDFLAAPTILGFFRVEPDELLRSTGMRDLDGLSGTIQVDCRATGFRETVTVPVLSAVGAEAPLQVRIGPHTVAGELEVRYGLVLDREREVGLEMAASKRGSRVYTPTRSYRFPLEGDAAGFPTEAFDFEPTGYPSEACWHLNFRADSLDEPFMGAVRLFINTGHPAASTLLSGVASIHRSVLFHGVVEQLLVSAASRWSDELPTEYEEGTVGHVLQELSSTYLRMGLAEAISAVHGDGDRVFTRLRAATGLLEGRQ
ncbi:hypothetical protein H5398_15025 [Tessaracoccus sp. MC1679]|uniref:hypothetical protein n=1 Tax=Tessaracoccus sp. MC1679 TaxID=2760313 RepID=UPI0016024711|nr:hypothetical protein [Tessaracoccus sp. MC1679]MBB1517268.1 hypothetical protein [Tessaracoccus sp. MC1679]